MSESSSEFATFEIERNTNPAAQDVERLRKSLSAYNRTQIPDKGFVPILLTLVRKDGTFSGGLSAQISYGWLFTDTLWVAEHARFRGQGRRLMLAAEEEALSRNCRRAWVDTFSFQSRRFYEKLGYVVFGELEEYPPGHQRYFLRKTLVETSETKSNREN